MKSFASDNFSGIHPAVLEAIGRANVAHARSYGYDEVTAAAEELFKKEFGSGIAVHFVLIGTAANVLSIKTLATSYEAVIVAEESHLNMNLRSGFWPAWHAARHTELRGTVSKNESKVAHQMASDYNLNLVK